jgi:hypothetical protein
MLNCLCILWNLTDWRASVLSILRFPVNAGGDGPVLGQDENVETVVLTVALKKD